MNRVTMFTLTFLSLTLLLLSPAISCAPTAPKPPAPAEVPPTPMPTPAPTPPREQEKVIIIDYDELVKECRDNPIAAKQKYEGKLAQLSGEIVGITEVSGKARVEMMLGEPSPLWGHLPDAFCTFIHKSDVLPLCVGDNITVRGRISSIQERSHYVFLKDCYIPQE